MTSPTPGRIHTLDIQMRYSDTDALGHLNNGAYAIYAEVARLDFLSLLGGTRPSLILAHLALDFRRQVRFGEPVNVETWVERIGTTSVTLGHLVRAAGERAADVRAVVVHFDYESQRPRPWTPANIEALEGYLLVAPPAGARTDTGR